jgi:hypothetical protein
VEEQVFDGFILSPQLIGPPVPAWLSLPTCVCLGDAEEQSEDDPRESGQRQPCQGS